MTKTIVSTCCLLVTNQEVFARQLSLLIKMHNMQIIFWS